MRRSRRERWALLAAFATMALVFVLAVATAPVAEQGETNAAPEEQASSVP